MAFDIALRAGTSFDISLGAVAESTFNQGGVDYLLRDLFTSDLDPLVDANASEGSGVGYRDITGTGMYALGGRLRGGGASTNLCYRKTSGGSGWNRVGGRTFTAIVSPWDGDLDDLYFHLSETAGGIDGYGLRIVGGSSIYAYEPDGTTTLLLRVDDNPIKAVRYQLGITLNQGEGAVYWIAAMQDYVVAGTEWDLPAAPDARILWVSQIGTATTFYPTIRNDGTSADHAAWEDVRLLDVSGWAGADGMALVADRFDRSDTTNDNATYDDVRAGTFGISGNKAYLVSSGGATSNIASYDAGVDDNVILVVKHNTGTSSVGNSGIAMCYDPVSDYYVDFMPFDDATIRFESVGPSYSVIATGGPYITTNDPLRWVAMRQGNTYRYWVNGAPTQDILNPTTDTNHDHTGTYYGIVTWSGPDTGVTWDSLAVYPLLITLPSALQTTALDTPTVGSNLETKAFTDTNGTALSTHDADWTAAAGTWTIQSNRASASGSGDLYAYLSAGQADYQVTVDVIAGTLGDLRAGVVLRRADANNMLRVRLFVDTSQPANDEIEIEAVIGGSANVVQKCYLNDYFASSSTYELKCQVEGDVLYVYLDGVLHLVYYIPSSLSSGQGVGMYREGTVDDGATFDDFIVDAIGSTPAETGPLLLTAASGAAVSATSAAFTGQVIASATGAIATSATAGAFTGGLAASASTGISSAASAGAFGQAAVSATGDIAVSATAGAFTGGLAAGATGGISTAASTEAFAGALTLAATSGASVTASAAGGAGETGPLDLSAVSGAAVSATTEAFTGAVAASAVSGIATSASAEAFTGGLAVSATGDISTAASTAAFVGALSISATGSISVSASAAETYDAGPLTLSATGSIGVSATSEAFTGAIGVQATSGVGTSASSEAFAQALASALGEVAVTATSEAFTGGLTLSGVSGIVSFATTATVPIAAAFSMARAATAGLTVTAAAGAGVSIEAEDVAALAITLAASGTIETDEAASAALEFTP